MAEQIVYFEGFPKRKETKPSTRKRQAEKAMKSQINKDITTQFYAHAFSKWRIVNCEMQYSQIAERVQAPVDTSQSADEIVTALHQPFQQVSASARNAEVLDQSSTESQRNELTLAPPKKTGPVANKKKKKIKYIDITKKLFSEASSPVPSDTEAKVAIRVQYSTMLNQWSCHMCKFVNSPTQEECELCGESKIEKCKEVVQASDP